VLEGAGHTEGRPRDQAEAHSVNLGRVIMFTMGLMNMFMTGLMKLKEKILTCPGGARLTT
jgi:hypothetical protein